jgi:hypothetical protein
VASFFLAVKTRVVENNRASFPNVGVNKQDGKAAERRLKSTLGESPMPGRSSKTAVKGNALQKVWFRAS